MTDEENKKSAEKIYNYLKNKLKEEGAKKIMNRVAKKLGVSGYANLIGGNFPAATLAKFSVGYLKLMAYESYFSLNGQWEYNKFNPATSEDAYVEYLLYSWVRGKPGYIYQFDALPNKL